MSRSSYPDFGYFLHMHEQALFLAPYEPLLVYTDAGIRGYACYDCCMLSSPAFACMLHLVSTFWYFNPYILQHFTKNVFTLVSLVFTVCSNTCINLWLSCRVLPPLHTYLAIVSDSYTLSCSEYCLLSIQQHVMIAIDIRESVDSLCRDGTNTPIRP